MHVTSDIREALEWDVLNVKKARYLERGRDGHGCLVLIDLRREKDIQIRTSQIFDIPDTKSKDIKEWGLGLGLTRESHRTK